MMYLDICLCTRTDRTMWKNLSLVQPTRIPRLFQPAKGCWMCVASLDDVVFELAQQRKVQEQILKSVNGFIGNISKSNEIEVVEAVAEHIRKKDSNMIENISLNHRIHSQGRLGCEVDGFIELKNEKIVVIEVKSNLTVEGILQVKNVMSVVKCITGFSHVYGFAGGPLLESKAKRYALTHGISIVEVSGQRCRIIPSFYTGADDYSREADLLPGESDRVVPKIRQ